MDTHARSKGRLAIAMHRVGLAAALVLLLSCEGAVGPQPKPGSGQGTVALFITDNISMYKQVVTTVTGVRLVNSGTGEVCETLPAPVLYDVSNLTDRAQYTALSTCREGIYNRIDVEFLADVRLMDQLGAASACTFVSYTHESGAQRPLDCDPATGKCTVSIAAGLKGSWFTVQEDRYNDLGVDFNLKEFTVTDPSACTVNMKLSLATASMMNSSGRAHSAAGLIQDLDTANRTFTLITGGATVTVDYSSILPALQPNIDALLQAAATDGLGVSVLTGRFDLAAGTVVANRIFVKAAGTAGNVLGPPQRTFELATGPSTTLACDRKAQAEVAGDFIDGAWVNVKFDGYDQSAARYIAASIEVLPAGTVLAD